MLRIRLPVGAALIALLASLLWLDARWQDTPAAWWPGGALPAGLLLGAFALIVLVPALATELTRLLRQGGMRAWPLPVALTVAAGAFAAVCLHAWKLDGPARLAAGLALLGLAPCLAALLRSDGARAIAELGRWLMVAAWIGALPACWIALRAHVPWWALAGAVLTVKCNDMGAYFAGVALGRHRMAPWISPKKTWEGFAGGTLASLAAGAWLGNAMGLGAGRGLAFGAMASVLGPMGDLAESILKRQAGAKDSGAWIPGMGGAFDVLDSLLLAAPAALWLLAGH
jgi:phosphatidate cytidylyltransferase